MTSHDALCPACQSDTVRLVHLRVPINKTVSFLDEHSRCESCGEEFHTYDQSLARSRARTTALQRAEGLPTVEEILEARATVGLSQAQFEKALGLGQKTMIRWERGTVPPSPAARFAIWVARNHPSAFLEYAAARMPELAEKRIAQVSASEPGPIRLEGGSGVFREIKRHSTPSDMPNHGEAELTEGVSLS